MNFIELLNDRFVLFNPEGQEICDLGDSITVLLRTSSVQKDCLVYVVEIKESLIHGRESVSKNNLAEFTVGQVGHDARTCMSVFNKDAFGKEHRLTVHPFSKPFGPTGFALAIDGLLWDGKILHVRDLV